jgi:hypothetical protein
VLKVDNYVSDGHSIRMVEKFCKNRIKWEYDSFNDVLTIDENNIFPSLKLEDSFWDFLADIRNFDDTLDTYEIDDIMEL